MAKKTRGTSVSIDDLLLDEKNANKGTKRGRELLQKSLQKYGAGRSVLLDKNNRICYGMEIEPKYVAVSLQRLADMGLKPKMVKHAKKAKA